MSASEDNKDRSEILWRQYAQHVDLYKFYIGAVIRMNLFYYAVTGGILSYYFANVGNPWVQYSLLMPMVFSLGYLILFCFGAFKMPAVREDVSRICKDLDLRVFPEMNVLVMLLWVSAAILLIVGIAIVILFGSTCDRGHIEWMPASIGGLGSRWLSSVGLGCDLVGAVVLAASYFVRAPEAIELGVSRICSDDPEENLKLPAVRDRLRQARDARVGVSMIAIGFLLQLIGGWPGH